MKYFTALLLITTFFLFSCKNETETTSEKSTTMNENPLLENWETPFGIPPFDKIKSEDYLPAIREAIKIHNSEIEEIINNAEAPSFKNTIEALSISGRLLNRVSNTFYAIEAANTNDILKDAKKKISPELTVHGDEISLNPVLFERISKVYEKRENLSLSNEESFLLEKTYKNYVRAGVNLKGKNKERLKEINKRLSELSTAFGENLLNETNNFEIHLTNKEDLGDLSEALVASAASEAKKRGHEAGWSFTLSRPSVNPFLQSSPNREFREKIFQGYAMRGNNNNENDNKDIIIEMTTLRLEKANLLGYQSHADYILANNMAEKPEAVYNLMNQLWSPALEMAKKDRASLAKIMKSEGINEDFRGSDWRYYVAKIRKQRYNFNEDETRPYFEVNAVRDGAFLLAKELFGLTFTPMKDAPKWHEDQQVFEVKEADGTHLGVIYMDFFTRESKRGGAWMNALRGQNNFNGFVTPIVTNNFNFPPPTKDNPSLLSFTEAQTMFHEFGHALHGLLSHVKYPNLAGTNVPRDFVEFPSQVMENWMSEPRVLAMYAKHYKTGEVIPAEMIKKMNEANDFNEGFRTVEYMAAAYLDMDWHSITEPTKKEVNTFEKDAMSKIGLINEILPRYRSTYYNHIFASGYSAGYYSYMWSEVLDADTFAEFKKTGDIFNKELAKKYREMLASGGTKTGVELYRDFIGRDPEITPLLKKKGFE